MGMPATFEVPVVGVTFQPKYPASITSLKENSSVEIIQDPNNSADPNAIKVQGQDGTILGYIPAAVAKKLTIELEKGNRYDVVIRPLVNPEHSDRPGAMIKLKKISCK
jgi:hypothetical protein